MSTVCWVILQVLLWPPGVPNPSPSWQAKVSRSIPVRHTVCMRIAAAAKAEGVDPILAVSVGWEESGLTEGLTSSKGAKGPLGVMPQYHCPKKGRCDYVVAGVSALHKVIAARPNDLCAALALYNRGWKGECAPGRKEYGYAKRVLKRANRLRRHYYDD